MGNLNNWLQIQTIGTESNYNGIGAVITVIPDLAAYDENNPQPGTFMTKFIDGGSNYLAHNELIAHFGLGPAGGGGGLVGVQSTPMVDLVRIEWPNGIVQELFDVEGNQRLTVVESGPSTTSVPLPSAVFAALPLIIGLGAARLRRAKS